MSSPVCANLSSMMATFDRTAGFDALAAAINAIDAPSRSTYHSLSEIKSIVSDYYHHDWHKLTEPERWAHPDFVKLAEDDLKPPGKSDRKLKHPPKILIRSTGKPLRERLLWADLRTIFKTFEAEATRIGEVTFTGWTAYVLRQWVSAGKRIDDWPEVKSQHTETAVRKLIARIEMLL